jgi:quercetin dioxygenase-like cupin family protein
MPFTLLDEAPVFETPNATMRSYATPSQNGSDVAVWRTEMAPGSSGPLHAADREQVLVVIEGHARIELNDETRDLGPGDAAVIPAGTQRRIANPFKRHVVLLAAGGPSATAATEKARAVPIPWTT